MKKFFSALIICLVVVVCDGYSQKPLELTFKLPKGASYNYSMAINMAVKGQDVNVTNAMGMGYDFKVLDDSSGWKKISATISKITMDMSAKGVTIHYNSDEPLDTENMVNGIFGKIFGAMKGGQFSFIMNEKGEIGYVKGIDEMVNRITDAVPEAAAASGSISSAFDEGSFKKNLQQVFGAYPGKSVKPGDSWTNSYTTSSNGVNMNMNNTYMLESVSGGIANVKVDLKISSADGTVPLNGTSSGVLKYDVGTGVPVDGDLDMDLKIGEGTSEEAVPIDIIIKTKITGKK